ncbi:MAG: SHOCT domain-containing protein [Clostridiaceae bacterium]
MMNWGGMMGYFGWLGMLLGILVLIAFALIIMAIFTRPDIKSQGSTEMPLDILKKRYAKGEITKEEYEKIREDLLS